MLKKLAISLISLILFIGFQACNSSSDLPNETVAASSDVSVSAFSLKANSNILSNLDSVFFSIDLVNAKIFNADSLPCGTDISRLLVNVTAPSTASTVELKYKNQFERDTTVTYTSEFSDSINFAAGEVTLHIVAADGTTKRDYDISVNVHKVVADTLIWDQTDLRTLPSLFAKPEESKTVEMNKTIYCLTSHKGEYSVSATTDPYGEWKADGLDFPFVPEIESFATAGGNFFILSKEGELFKSADLRQWTSCGQVWSHIFGEYDTSLIGLKKDGGNYFTASYPESKSVAVPAGLPVKSTSQLYQYGTIWSPVKQVIMLGGRDRNNQPVASAWAYDGNEWVEITQRRPCAAAGFTMFPYYIVSTSEITWNQKKESVLVALGGTLADGTNNRNVYISRDLGFNWALADSLMQLPEFFPSLAGSQAFVVNYEMTVDSRSETRQSAEWSRLPLAPLPRWWHRPAGARSRATADITSWEVPYIYMYGGTLENGELSNTVWRGVISNLTFKPLQ